MSWSNLAAVARRARPLHRDESGPRAANNRVPETWVLTTGERMTAAMAVRDPRNIYGLTDSSFRRRLQAGVLDPADLFDAPNRYRNRIRWGNKA